MAGVVHSFINHMKGLNEGPDRVVSGRHIGSLVSDFHRNLIKGGTYLYPADRRTGRGKLRLLYEGNPLAFLADVAGGDASSGEGKVLSIQPESLHQRCGLVIGSKADVSLAEALIRRTGGAIDESPTAGLENIPCSLVSTPRNLERLFGRLSQLNFRRAIFI